MRKERTGGRSGRGRERRCGDPSRSARPTPRGSAGLPRLRLLRSAPPRRPPPQHAPHSRACRGPSFVATTSAVRRARARALARTGADGGNEAKAGPPARKRLWLGAEQSRRRARRARAPLPLYLPCRGSSQIPGDGARPFLRTHWARGSEAHPLPSPGHAFSRGSRGDGPSGQVRSCSPSQRYLRALNKGDMGSPSRRGGRHNLGRRREDFRGKGRTQRDSGVLTGTSTLTCRPLSRLLCADCESR